MSGRFCEIYRQLMIIVLLVLSEIMIHSVNSWLQTPLQTLATEFINDFKTGKEFREVSSFHWSCFGERKKFDAIAKVATKGGLILKPSQFLGHTGLQTVMDFINHEKCQYSTIAPAVSFHVLIITNEVPAVTRGIHKCTCGLPVTLENSFRGDMYEVLRVLV